MCAKAFTVVRSHYHDRIFKKLLVAQHSNEFSQGGIGSGHSTIV